jgi:hypothetical protein
MNRNDLKSVLDDSGIDSSKYSLFGGNFDGRFVIDKRATGWVVFFAENGGEHALKQYITEGEACLDLLTRLLKA